MLKQLTLAAVAGTALILASGTALATVPFPNDTGVAGGLSWTPTVNTGLDTVNLGIDGTTSLAITGLGVSGGSNEFTGPVSMTAANDVLSFSPSVGGILANVDPALFTWGSTGQYTFDLQSIDTTAFTLSPSSNQIALYLLGNINDSSGGFGPATPMSFTVTINQTCSVTCSPWSASATEALPPVAPPPPPPPPGVPEPASMALLGAGLAGLGLVRRRRKS